MQNIINQGNEEMVVFILAGGEGSRLESEMKNYPKPLMMLINESIIGLLVKKLVNYNNHVKIKIVTKNIFKNHFDDWRKTFLSKNNNIKYENIEILYEDEANQGGDDSKQGGDNSKQDGDDSKQDGDDLKLSGTLPAFQKFINKYVKDNSIFFVFTGDNYFDDNLLTFFADCYENLDGDKCISYNASYLLDNYKDAKNFGVIHVKNEEENIIDKIDEKPLFPDEADRLISTGCYAFFNNEKTSNILQQFIDDPNDKEKSRREISCKGNVAFVDTAHFLIHLLDNNQTLKHSQLQGKWFDIGRREDLAKAVLHYIKNNLDAIHSLADLKNRSHYETNDRVLVALSPWQIEFDSKTSTITLNLKHSDKVCKSKQDAEATIHQDSFIELKKIISKLIDSDKNIQMTEYEERLKACNKETNGRLLISGGVLLIDCPTPKIIRDDNLYRTDFRLRNSRLPFQLRDFEAILDPNMLTMPAGGLDNLSLKQCCYDELREEFIFYGVEHENQTDRVVFYLEPPGLEFQHQDDINRFLSMIVNKNIMIPGLDNDDIKEAIKNENLQYAKVKKITVNEANLESFYKKPNVWKIIIKYEDKDNRIEEIEEGWFFVILDKETNTIEFRKIASADITKLKDNDKIDRNSYLFGRIAGIADGEGFGRIPFIFDSDSWIQSFIARDRNIKVLAYGSPNSGKFKRFGFYTPSFSVTRTVKKISIFLKEIIR